MPITLADYLLYDSEPIHFWAKSTGLKAKGFPDGMAAHRKHAENEARELAKQYLLELKKRQYGHWNDKTNFEIDLRGCSVTIDGLFYDKGTDAYDAFFIYIGTDASNQKYQVTYKKIVAEYKHNIRHCYLIHLNSEYRRDGKIEPEMLFRVTLVDEYIAAHQLEVVQSLADALQMQAEAQRWFGKKTNDELLPCTKPSECMYPEVCHPFLEQHQNRNPSPATIYDIPRLPTARRREFRASGIIELAHLSDDTELSPLQRRHVEVMKSGKPSIDYSAVSAFCRSVTYPLTFLDYEAAQFPVPLDGFQPYNSVPFQYSLHIIDAQGSEPRHVEFLSTDKSHNGEKLLDTLFANIPRSGTILTWNSSYEKGIHKTLAAALPSYAHALNALNDRIVDLAKCFSNPEYMHPEFKGSWSIKAILPVIRGNDPYGKFKREKHVSDGAEAVGAWWQIAGGSAGFLQKGGIRSQLLAYCKQDTQSMVDIWLHMLSLRNQR
jgi:hypothetical protein